MAMTTPRYWVIPCTGGHYPDDRNAYSAARNRAECAELGLIDFGYLDNPGAYVYAGDREPWTEQDPYPDFVIERGPRGGVKWERA